MMQACPIDIDVPVASFVPDRTSFKARLLPGQLQMSGIQYNASFFRNQPGKNLLARPFFDLNPVEV